MQSYPIYLLSLTFFITWTIQPWRNLVAIQVSLPSETVTIFVKPWIIFKVDFSKARWGRKMPSLRKVCLNWWNPNKTERVYTAEQVANVITGATLVEEAEQANFSNSCYLHLCCTHNATSTHYTILHTTTSSISAPAGRSEAATVCEGSVRGDTDRQTAEVHRKPDTCSERSSSASSSSHYTTTVTERPEQR